VNGKPSDHFPALLPGKAAIAGEEPTALVTPLLTSRQSRAAAKETTLRGEPVIG
jgi:hypothetical protein